MIGGNPAREGRVFCARRAVQRNALRARQASEFMLCYLRTTFGFRGHIMKSTITAALAAAALLFTTSLASAQAVCAVAIIFAAGYIGSHENRELTPKEAMTCGLSYLMDKNEAKTKPVKKTKMKKGQRHAAAP